MIHQATSNLPLAKWKYTLPFKTENCPQSVLTIDIVDACPKDITEYIKAKERKQCH